MAESEPTQPDEGQWQGGPSTRSAGGSYDYQWKLFGHWCLNNTRRILPAKPADVADYLYERTRNRSRPSTVRVAAAAIARAHVDEGFENPCQDPLVQSTLAIISRNEKPSRPRVHPLDLDCFYAIRMSAHRPRPGRGGKMEDEWTATARGDIDVAMIGLMRDAMLRVREATELRWRDLEELRDDTGRIRVQRLYQSGETEYRMVSAETMKLLLWVKRGSENHERIINLSPNQIGLRIAAAARQAGLGSGYSGESPRVGMLSDLESLGVLLLGEYLAERKLPPPGMRYFPDLSG